MNIHVFLVDPEKMLLPLKGKWEIKAAESTGLKPTDIFGIKNPDKTVTVSTETWKRIELFAEILSAVDMTISEEKLNETFGGRS
jgi:hypothetical protein